MNLIDQAENKNKWQAVVSTVMNCWVPKAGSFPTIWGVVNFWRKTCCMELVSWL